MSPIYLYNGKILTEGGAIAVAEACCCEEIPCDTLCDAEPCETVDNGELICFGTWYDALAKYLNDLQIFSVEINEEDDLLTNNIPWPDWAWAAGYPAGLDGCPVYWVSAITIKETQCSNLAECEGFCSYSRSVVQAYVRNGSGAIVDMTATLSATGEPQQFDAPAVGFSANDDCECPEDGYAQPTPCVPEFNCENPLP